MKKEKVMENLSSSFKITKKRRIESKSITPLKGKKR
jgi:hypothetical protein